MRIFNYQISRVRRVVECAFGVLAQKWRVLHTPITTNIDVTDKIVLACVVLHNAIIEHEGCELNEESLEYLDDSVARGENRCQNVYSSVVAHYAKWIRRKCCVACKQCWCFSMAE